jgi:hypothetical protein
MGEFKEDIFQEALQLKYINTLDLEITRQIMMLESTEPGQDLLHIKTWRQS